LCMLAQIIYPMRGSETKPDTSLNPNTHHPIPINGYIVETLFGVP
jgi:hypothetical protein